VAYEVADGNGLGPGAGGEVARGAEATPAVAEQHADGGVAGVRRGQVEMAVVVEVARGHGLGARADGVVATPDKAGREAVFQDFEVGPMRRGSRGASPPVLALTPVRRQGG